jgi:hypothetical protein
MNLLNFNKKDWLKDAVSMDTARSSSLRLRCLVEALFEEITPLIKVSSKSRQKEALKTTLMNLIRAHQLDKPIRYSRDKNRYTRDRRYGKLHFKYDRLIPIIRELENLGYIEQSSFYFDHEKKEGLQTRMWGTDKLWTLCQEYRLIQSLPLIPELPEDEEIIILRNEDKQDIGYRETPQTQQMREDLERYNDLVDKHEITVRLEGSTIVDNRYLVENLYGNIRNGKVWIKSVKFNNNHNKYNFTIPIPFFKKHKKLFHINPFSIINKLIDRIQTIRTSSITNTKRRIILLGVLLRRFWSDAHLFQKDLEKRSYEISRIPWKTRQDVLAEEFRLRGIGVDELVFVLDHEHLRRIFNRKSWKCGGRAYGAFHQDMLRKYMRKDILIDGQPTAEIDFSAYHILMLYHQEGIDYQDDPYTVCEGTEMRAIYKAVGLIAINAESNKSAYGAIRDELRARGIPAPQRDEPLKTLVRKFREAHKGIEHHLFSDAGIELQNIDSKIMNAILVRLMDHGILGLSVYDSVIVAEQYAEILRDIMVREYNEVMGFKPVL